MHPLGDTLLGITFVWGVLWLLAVLVRDFGGSVIALFFSVVGNVILAVMILIDIRNTWKPLLFIIGGSLLSALFYGIGL